MKFKFLSKLYLKVLAITLIIFGLIFITFQKNKFNKKLLKKVKLKGYYDKNNNTNYNNPYKNHNVHLKNPLKFKYVNTKDSLDNLKSIVSSNSNILKNNYNRNKYKKQKPLINTKQIFPRDKIFNSVSKINNISYYDSDEYVDYFDVFDKPDKTFFNNYCKDTNKLLKEIDITYNKCYSHLIIYISNIFLNLNILTNEIKSISDIDLILSIFPNIRANIFSLLISAYNTKCLDHKINNNIEKLYEGAFIMYKCAFEKVINGCQYDKMHKDCIRFKLFEKNIIKSYINLIKDEKEKSMFNKFSKLIKDS